MSNEGEATMFKLCRKCYAVKPIDEFYKTGKDTPASHCKECVKSALRIKRATDPEYREKKRRSEKARRNNQEFVKRENERLLQLNRRTRYLPKCKARSIFYSRKCDADRKGIPFEIHLEWVVAMVLLGHCERSKLKFDLSPIGDHERRYNPLAPSIDRINPTKGYVYGNVQIVCNMYNLGKNSFDEKEFIRFCHAVAKHNPI